jgi:hypothetical protein
MVGVFKRLETVMPDIEENTLGGVMYVVVSP